MRPDVVAILVYYEDGDEALSEFYSSYEQHDPQNFQRLSRYVVSLVDRLKNERFPVGKNLFDTGFYNFADPTLTERQLKLRKAHTKRVQQKYDEGFLQPVLNQES